MQVIHNQQIFKYLNKLMKHKQYLLLLVLLTLVTCSTVIKLTDSDFKQTISAHKYVMVKFYAPWCGHCKTMAPEYVKLAELANDNDIVIAEIDATQNKQVAEQFKIEGYPFVIFFIDSLPVDYRGVRKADQMYKWIKQVTEIVLQQISQEKIIELRTQENLVVYFGKDPKKTKTIELLNIVDNSMNYFIHPSESQKLIIYLKDKQQIEYAIDAEFSVAKIKSWALLTTLPIVIPLANKQYLDWVFYDVASLKDVAMLLKQKDLTKKAFTVFQQFCLANQDRLKCCLIDQTMEVYGGVKGYLRSKGNSVLALTREQLKQAYIYPNSIDGLTQQQWNQFVSQVEEGNHTNFADAASEKLEYNYVKTLTDENFTDFIKQNKIVLVEFYSPGCTHCVQFAEEFDKIAKKVGDDKLGFQVTALDLKKNKKIAAKYRITSYPLFRVYVDEQYVDYEGPRTSESLLKFVKMAEQNRPIAASSIAEVPSPSVIIYDPALETQLKLLPSLFTKYPIYHIKQGKKISVVLKTEEQKTYGGELQLQAIATWLHRLTDPVLVDLLKTSLDNKLVEALQNKIPILGLVDVEPELSASLRNTLEEYCKQSKLACGYAKKGEDNFEQFTKWAGIPVEESSKLILIKTQTFEKFAFNQNIEQLSVQSIDKFINDFRQGKLQKIVGAEDAKQVQEEEEQQVKQASKAQQTEEQQADQIKQQQTQSKNDQL